MTEPPDRPIAGIEGTAGLLRAAGWLAAAALYGTYWSGAVAPLLMAVAAGWAWASGIGVTAARDGAGPFRQLWCLAGAATVTVVAWASGMPSPLTLTIVSVVAAAWGMALAATPSIRRRMFPALEMFQVHEVMEVGGHPVSHLALVPPSDRTARWLMRLAACRLTPGHPALCGRQHPNDEAEGICQACVDLAVDRCEGRAVVGEAHLTWDDPFIGMVAVVGSLRPERG